MGKSAKLHKRVKKPKLPGGGSGSKSNAASSNITGSTTQSQVQTAKKKALKDKAAKGPKPDGPILGGADYVSLMMGGRRKARQEAAKLPISQDS